MQVVAAGHLHALVVQTGADTADHELFGYLHRQRLAVFLTDQTEHQVEAAGATGAGDAAAVDLEQFLGDQQCRVAFAKGIDGFPVQGQALVLEQSRFSQHEAAGVDAAEDRQFRLASLQPVRQMMVVMGQRFEAGDHEQRLAVSGQLQAGVDVERHAVAGLHGIAILAEQAPAIQLAAKAIGHAQRFDGRHQAHHREAGQQQEAEGLGHVGHDTGAGWQVARMQSGGGFPDCIRITGMFDPAEAFRH